MDSQNKKFYLKIGVAVLVAAFLLYKRKNQLYIHIIILVFLKIQMPIKLEQEWN